MMKNYQFFPIKQNKLLLLLLQIALVIDCYGQQLDKKFAVPNYGDIGYLEHLPNNYHTSTTSYPVLIFLHGAGERGNGTTDLARLKKNGPPKHIEEGHTMQFNVDGKVESFIVISPQLRSDYNSWPPFYVDLVIEHVKNTYNIDHNRIYLTGLSMGGGACWAYASNSSVYADKIAAMVPICGHQSFNSSKVHNIADSHVAVWAHHGDADTSTPIRYSQDWVNGINNYSAGLAKLTTYEGVNHSGAWIRGYDPGHTFNNPNIYEWLLQQKRGEDVKWPDSSNEPDNQLPVANAGPDIEIKLPTDQVQINGSNSSDPDGSIVSYAWTQSAGPNMAQLTSQTTSSLTVTSLIEGNYTFKLKVTDDEGATDEDQVIVTVLSDMITDPSPSPSPGDDDGGCGCDHMITSANPYVNGENLGVQPGDVICIEAGQYPYLNLFNFKGSASAPITIKNCGGQVRIGNSSTSYGIVMNNNHYFRLTGSGDSNYKYGFKIDGGSKYLASGFAIAGKSSDFEIDHLEISTVEAGVLAKTNPSCDSSTWNENYIMRNVKFHDFFVHDIKGEGFYIGHTSLNVNVSCNGITQTVVPHDIENIEVYDNILQNTGWDGIQVSRANKNCSIYNNRIHNYGTENKSSQQAGIIVGGESTGRVFNNWVEHGTGSGIQVFGTGEVMVYNNVIKDAGEDAIFCDDRSPVSFSAKLINNTIVTPKRDGIRLYNNEGNDNIVNNNIIIAPGSLGDYSNTENSYLFVANGVSCAKSTNLFSTEVSDVSFKDALNNDFALNDNSSAVDAGTQADQFGIMSDFAGTSRPVNGAYDIGAYEALTSPSPLPEPEKSNGLNYSYYEGEWSMLPNFSTLAAVKSGQVTNFDLSIRERDYNFAVMYSGSIEIPVTGDYTFETASDDGSKLYIGGYDESFLVVDNDGAHGKRFREGTVHLSAGVHPIVVTFFEKGGSEILEVYWKNTAHGVTSRQAIPDEHLLREDSNDEQSPELVSKKFNINFTKQGVDSHLSDWNDIALDNLSASTSYGNIADAEGNASAISVTVYHGELGYTLLGVADNQSSLTNGVYPDAVLRYTAYTTGKASIKVSNLDPNKLYNLQVHGGRAGSGERVTEYIVNGVMKELQCMNNTSQIQVFENLTPNPNQEIIIEFQQGGNTWAYMNALVIEEVSNAASRVNTTYKASDHNNSQHTDAKELHISSKIKVYPNPFRDHLKILVDSQNHEIAEVTVMDQWGREMHKSTLSIPSTGSNEFRMDMTDSLMKSGIYFVLVKLDGGEAEIFKLLVQRD